MSAVIMCHAEDKFSLDDTVLTSVLFSLFMVFSQAASNTLEEWTDWFNQAKCITHKASASLTVLHWRQGDITKTNLSLILDWWEEIKRNRYKIGLNYAHMYSHMTHTSWKTSTCTRRSPSHAGCSGWRRAFTPLMKPIRHCEFSEERMHSNHRNKY